MSECVCACLHACVCGCVCEYAQIMVCRTGQACSQPILVLRAIMVNLSIREYGGNVVEFRIFATVEINF